MLVIYPGQDDPSSRRRAGAGERRGDDAVARDRVVRGLARRGAADDDSAAPGSRNVRAERAEIILKRDDLRLARRAVDGRPPLGGAGCEHDVFRRADARKAQIDLRSVQFGRAAEDIAALFADLGSHRAQSGQVQVDRPFAELAAAGKTEPGLAAASEQRAHENDRRTHLGHQLPRDVRIGDRA